VGGGNGEAVSTNPSMSRAHRGSMVSTVTTAIEGHEFSLAHHKAQSLQKFGPLGRFHHSYHHDHKAFTGGSASVSHQRDGMTATDGLKSQGFGGGKLPSVRAANGTNSRHLRRSEHSVHTSERASF